MRGMGVGGGKTEKENGAQTRACAHWNESCALLRGLRSHKYLRDLDTEVGLEGRVQIGIGADIGKGLDNNLGVLLDEEVNSGIESSANGLGGGTLLQSRGFDLDGGDGGAEEHGEHGQEEGEESGGLHDGDIRDVRVRRVVLREGDEVGSR